MVRLRLMPSLKEKRHYLVFQGEQEKADKAILEFLGILGYAKAGPIFIEHKNNKGILSFNRKYSNEIKASLVFYNIHTLGISGTIKKAREKFLK